MKILTKLKFLDFLLLAAFLLALVFLFRFFNPEEEWIDASVYTTNIPVFQANSLRVSDIEKNPSGKIIAEITGIQIYDTLISPASTIITKDISVNKDVFVQVKILARANPRTGDFEYKNKPIKVGSQLEFRFNTGFISGKVASFGDFGKAGEKEEKIITVVLYDQWPWLIDNIVFGDIGTKEDIIEIIDKDVQPSFSDTRKVDIALRLRIRVQELGQEFIFRNKERIAVGEMISFTAGNTIIQDALIKEIE